MTATDRKHRCHRLYRRPLRPHLAMRCRRLDRALIALLQGIKNCQFAGKTQVGLTSRPASGPITPAIQRRRCLRSWFERRQTRHSGRAGQHHREQGTSPRERAHGTRERHRSESGQHRPSTDGDRLPSLAARAGEPSGLLRGAARAARAARRPCPARSASGRSPPLHPAHRWHRRRLLHPAKPGRSHRRDEFAPTQAHRRKRSDPLRVDGDRGAQ